MFRSSARIFAAATTRTPNPVEMQLHIRVLSGPSGSCAPTPLADTEIYIWHTDAQGLLQRLREARHR